MKSKITTYIAIFASILLAVSLAKNLLKISEINKSIEKEKERVEKLRAENKRLNDEITKTNSDQFIEKQLRDKLGLAKKGEIVLVLPDPEIVKKLAPEIPKEEDTLPDPNWKKWLKLFF